MNTPNWAHELIVDAVKYLQSEGYKCRMPVVEWRSKPYRHDSSGACYPNHISITAGKSKRDCKLVILHELAHWALPFNHRTFDWVFPLRNTGHVGHTPKFWDTAWKLYLWAGLPEKYCLERERNYRKGAEIAYRRIK